MAFNADPFKQAEEEVKNKSVGSQIAHSGIFHSVRSAFSNKSTSGVSKGLGVALGVGKLFLSLIPVPVVGSVVGAVADAIDGKARSVHHDWRKEQAKTNNDKGGEAKFAIKELTVENLDRYRWKVHHSIEELNSAITAYNASDQSCDDLYAYALLYEQAQRRKQLLRDELDTFTQVLKTVNEWIDEMEAKTGPLMLRVTNDVREKALESAQRIANAATPEAVNQLIATEHAKCKLWCCGKGEVKYNPSVGWGKAKAFAGQAIQFLQPIAMSSIAVKGSDYTSDSDNSKFN